MDKIILVYDGNGQYTRLGYPRDTEEHFREQREGLLRDKQSFIVVEITEEYRPSIYNNEDEFRDSEGSQCG